MTALPGIAVITLISQILKTGPENRNFGLISYCMTGLAFCAVYAQYASLFTGLAHVRIQIPLLIVSAAGSYCLFRPRAERTPDLRIALKENRNTMILAAVMMILFAYGASRGILHTDTGLYHAQSIRWAEEYGTVPGLANLHLRLGYNSSAFPLTALFSFPYLAGGRSIHGTGAFMALLLAVECFRIFPVFRRKEREGRAFRLSDFCRLAALYYLFAIFDEMISPASDYFLCIGVFYLVIRFLTYAEEGMDRELLPYCLLSLFGVFLVSVKLYAVMIVVAKHGHEVLWLVVLTT